MEIAGLSKEKVKKLKESFDMFDKDGSGKLDANEIFKIFRSTGKKITKSEVVEMINKIDENGDGEVDFPEFCHMYSNKEQETENSAAYQAQQKPKNLRAGRKKKEDEEEVSMTPEEQELFEVFNKFRADPTSIKEDVKTIKRGLKQLNPKDPMIPEYRNLKKELGIYEPVPALHYSPELSKAARDYLERPPTEKILRNEQCRGIAPDSFMQGESYTMAYYDDSYDTATGALCAMLAGKDDPEKYGKAYLTSDAITQVGLAIKKGEEDSSIALIFDDDPVVEDDWEADFDDSELRMAFDCLDYERKNRLDINKVLELVDEQGYAETYPTLVNMLKELQNKGEEYITYPEFAQHFHSRLQHEENNAKRDEEIFNVYLPDETNIKSIDNAQLKQIRDYIKLDMTDEQIETMLKMNQHNKFGVNFEEYKDRVTKK